jgi:hypothetical protein
VHEGGRGCEAIEEAELEGFVDLLDVGTVEVKFHGWGFGPQRAEAQRNATLYRSLSEALVVSGLVSLSNDQGGP